MVDKKKPAARPKCFWCGERLRQERKTKDHFISKPLKEFLKCGSEGTCVCCWECNQARSRISSLFRLLLQIRTGQPRHLKQQKAFLRLRKSLGSTMASFRAKIKQKLSAKVASCCLREIDEIKAYRPDERATAKAQGKKVAVPKQKAKTAAKARKTVPAKVVPKRPKKETRSYFDYNKCRDYLQAKYGYDERDYAGKFVGKGVRENVPYLDFWHWVLNHHQIQNGCFVVFTRWEYEDIEEEWVKVIYGHYLDEFADKEGNLDLYVWW